MLIRAPGAIAALALTLASALAMPPVPAQTQPPAQSDQDRKVHHPDGQAPGAQAAPTKPPGMPQMGGQSGGMMGQGGMMCGDMKKMMSMMQDMHGMMSAHAGMMSSRVEAGITKLRADLKVTDAQAPHWGQFADALRRNAKSMDGMHERGMAAALPDRLAGLEKSLLAHLNSVRALEQALQPLYASLNDEQRKVIDGFRIGPMGMM